MPFPFSRSLIVALDERWRASDVLADIANRLPSLGATNVSSTPTSLAFRVRWTTSSGPLFIVTSGEFSIDNNQQSGDNHQQSGRPHCLRVRLSFRRAAVIVALLTYGWLGVVDSLIEGGYTGGSLAGTVLFCTVGYCWLLGFWYLVVPPWLFRRTQLSRFAQPPHAGCPHQR